MLRAFEPLIIRKSIAQSLYKLLPNTQIKNPLLFPIYICAFLLTALYVAAHFGYELNNSTFILELSISLWLAIILSNLAESLAEERSKAHIQARQAQVNFIQAKKLKNLNNKNSYSLVPVNSLASDDYILVEAGDLIPCDGLVIEGIASVNESAVTGESAPVIRESNSENSRVTAGTKLLSDWLVIKIFQEHGQRFADHILDLVQSNRRRKTASELSLNVFLTALNLSLLLVCVTLLPYSIYSAIDGGLIVSISAVVALYFCLAPTTIGGLLSAISIAGIARSIHANIVVLSPHILELAGDIDSLILDKTGTVTTGNRQAAEFMPAQGVSVAKLAECAYLSSIIDETDEGKSIVALACERYGIAAREFSSLAATFIPFSAHTKISGLNRDSVKYRKGAATAMASYIRQHGGTYPPDVKESVDSISRKGGTCLVVAIDNQVLGVIYLKDIIKPGIKQRFARLRKLGIKTIMVTGDNQLTCAAIAAEAGVDDFVADAFPEDKLRLVKKLQLEGSIVAMTGDGTNDSPAMAQADIAIVMENGTETAKDAANIIDLDSNPTKLIEVIELGKQLLITRGALTSFSLANDLSKNLAILPAMFASTYPILEVLDVMKLHSPHSAILATVLYNTLIIGALIPLAIRGVKYYQAKPTNVLALNLLIYGVGGLVFPFFAIKVLDLSIVWLGLVT